MNTHEDSGADLDNNAAWLEAIAWANDIARCRANWKCPDVLLTIIGHLPKAQQMRIVGALIGCKGLAIKSEAEEWLAAPAKAENVIPFGKGQTR